MQLAERQRERVEHKRDDSQRAVKAVLAHLKKAKCAAGLHDDNVVGLLCRLSSAKHRLQRQERFRHVVLARVDHQRHVHVTLGRKPTKPPNSNILQVEFVDASRRRAGNSALRLVVAPVYVLLLCSSGHHDE